MKYIVGMMMVLSAFAQIDNASSISIDQQELLRKIQESRTIAQTVYNKIEATNNHNPYYDVGSVMTIPAIYMFAILTAGGTLEWYDVMKSFDKTKRKYGKTRALEELAEQIKQDKKVRRRETRRKYYEMASDDPIKAKKHVHRKGVRFNNRASGGLVAAVTIGLYHVVDMVEESFDARDSEKYLEKKGLLYPLALSYTDSELLRIAEKDFDFQIRIESEYEVLKFLSENYDIEVSFLQEITSSAPTGTTY